MFNGRIRVAGLGGDRKDGWNGPSGQLCCDNVLWNQGQFDAGQLPSWNANCDGSSDRRIGPSVTAPSRPRGDAGGRSVRGHTPAGSQHSEIRAGAFSAARRRLLTGTSAIYHAHRLRHKPERTGSTLRDELPRRRAETLRTAAEAHCRRSTRAKRARRNRQYWMILIRHLRSGSRGWRWQSLPGWRSSLRLAGVRGVVTETLG